MNSNFSWTKQWYPVSPLSYLDPSVPTPISLKHSSSYQLSNQDLSIMHSQMVNESTGDKTWQKKILFYAFISRRWHSYF